MATIKTAKTATSTPLPDLWPDDIAQVSATPPVSILQDQACKLGKKTGMLVSANVETTSERSQSFIHGFHILAPTLGYSARIFRVKHGVHFYPLEILTDVDGPNFRAATQDDFVRTLAEIFTSAPVRKIVQSLMAQANALATTAK